MSIIILEDFDIEDFNLWRIKNNKLREKISELNYNDYLANRNINTIEFEKKQKNNFDLLEYYFNHNNEIN